MKKQKGFSILIIPIIALVLAIAGVFGYKFYTDGLKAKTADIPVNKVTPPLTKSQGKPSKGYGTVEGPVMLNVDQAGTVSAQTDLETLLNQSDDGGEADLKSLDASAEGL